MVCYFQKTNGYNKLTYELKINDQKRIPLHLLCFCSKNNFLLNTRFAGYAQGMQKMSEARVGQLYKTYGCSLSSPR